VLLIVDFEPLKKKKNLPTRILDSDGNCVVMLDLYVGIYQHGLFINKKSTIYHMGFGGRLIHEIATCIEKEERQKGGEEKS